MKNDPRSHGLWERTAPPPPATVPLAGDIRADVAIVGAGFTGLSAALHLAEGGAKVVVLEAVEAGFGGSGRNVGLVNAGMWVMPDELPAVLGDTYGARLLDLLGHAPRAVFDLIDKHGIACEAERQGTLHCAVGEAGLAEIRSARGNGRRAAQRCDCSMPRRRRARWALPLTQARCSTSAPAPSSLWHMRAAWRMPLCAPA